MDIGLNTSFSLPYKPALNAGREGSRGQNELNRSPGFPGERSNGIKQAHEDNEPPRLPGQKEEKAYGLPEQEKSNQSQEQDKQTERSISGIELTEEEKQEVKELKTRDTEVRAHERAHLSAAGGLAKGSVNFAYETGPDGKRYAVGGEVSIDTSKVSGDPQATMDKARKIRRAALAPADPSSQDRSVAATAARMEAEARMELAENTREEVKQRLEPVEPQPLPPQAGEKILDEQRRQAEKNISDTYQRIQNSYLRNDVIIVDLFV